MKLLNKAKKNLGDLKNGGRLRIYEPQKAQKKLSKPETMTTTETEIWYSKSQLISKANFEVFI